MSNSTVPSSQPVSSNPGSTSVVDPTSSSQQAPTSSQQAPQSSSQQPQSSQAPVSTSTVTAPSSTPSTTEIVTHVTTIKTNNGNTTPVTVVKTRTRAIVAPTTQSGASSSSPAALQGGSGSSNGSGGLSTAGITAIAVVIPVAVVALLVGLGIWFWRKRKARKDADEQRRREMEDYSYNPNGDPTLPAIGSDAGGTQMTEDHSSGYRGWGAATASNRKASTTLSGGHTQQLSDAGSHGYGGPNSPGANYSDGHSSDPIVNNRDTMSSDDLGALGVAPAAGAGGIRRGPSNASSAYSAGGRSEHSDDAPPLPGPIDQSYGYQNQNYGYGQHGPYGDGTYGGGQEAGMPIVQDVSARRNTRIQPGGAYQQGNSGIAQNF